MPISFLEVPPGISIDSKRILVRKIQEALDQAYRIPDTRIFIHEWVADERKPGRTPRLGAGQTGVLP
jgi:hypothetical protein